MASDFLKEVAKKKSKGKFYIPRRYILCFLIFLAFCTMNCQRSCLSVAIVAMTSRTRHWEGGKWTSKPAEFHWDSEQKGIYLGAFFYGYLVLQIPSGYFCTKVGGKLVLGVSLLTASLISIMLPTLARINENFFFIARICQGLFLGVTLPANHYLWGKWAPSHEKAALVSFSIAGLSAGMLTSYPISGLLSQYGFAGGWPSVFYTFGGLGIAWALLWYVLVSDTPLEHPSIAKEELAIMDQLEGLENNSQKSDKVPWCKILSSVPVYAVIIGNFAFDCSYYTLLITLPLFLRDVHKFNVATTGLVSALPWLFMSISSPLAGMLSDRFRQRFSVSVTRKAFFMIGVSLSGGFLIVSGYLHSSNATIAVQCVSVFFYGFSFSSVMVNALDVGRKYGGIIIGISNSIATTPGFIGPAIVGIVTKDGTKEQWIEVFYGLATVSVIGGILFALLGSGEPCEWAKYDSVNDEINPQANFLNKEDEVIDLRATTDDQQKTTKDPG